PAARRADLSRRRRADAQRALSRAAAVAAVGGENPLRYHADVTSAGPAEAGPHTWRRRFVVHGIFWRRFLNWAAVRVPPWIEPVVIGFWALFFLLWGPGRRGVMRNLAAIKPGSSALANFFRCYRVFCNFAWAIGDTVR